MKERCTAKGEGEMTCEGEQYEHQSMCGWAMVFGAILLLVTLGKLDLLVILLPLSLLLALGIGCFARRKIPADGRHQKGVA